MRQHGFKARAWAFAAGVAALAAVVGFPGSAAAQQVFASPEAAAEAFVGAVTSNDPGEVKSVLGADFRRYIPQGESGDKTRFLEAWAKSHKVVAQGEGRAALEVGTNGWTLPIPIVKTGAGWAFDTKAAPAEMQKRRIGRNELAAIQVALAYADAQDEYFAKNPDRAAARHYATRGLSSPGKRDGLYWPSLAGEPESPLGPGFADAKPGQAYHGYLYRILKAQGKHAPGGAKSYVKNGLMTEGYALVAWPEKYGDTGVMTFIVSGDRVVHQKNLGPSTDKAARAMTAYDPDASWEKVPAP